MDITGNEPGDVNRLLTRLTKFQLLNSAEGAFDLRDSVRQAGRAYGVDADLLLEVVDISHENAIEQSETVNEILKDLNAADKPRVTALNKIDQLADPAEIDTSLYPSAVPVSALRKEGLDRLRARIAEVLSASMDTIQVVIPFTRGELVELFHRRGHVEREEHVADGISIAGSIPRFLRGYFEPYAHALRR